MTPRVRRRVAVVVVSTPGLSRSNRVSLRETSVWEAAHSCSGTADRMMGIVHTLAREFAKFQVTGRPGEYGSEKEQLKII